MQSKHEQAYSRKGLSRKAQHKADKEKLTQEISEANNNNIKGQAQHECTVRPMRATGQSPYSTHSTGVFRGYLHGLHDHFCTVDSGSAEQQAIANDMLPIFNSNSPGQGEPLASNGSRVLMETNNKTGVATAGNTRNLRASMVSSVAAGPFIGIGGGDFSIVSLNFGGGKSNSTYRSRNSPRPPSSKQQEIADHLGIEYEIIQAIEAVESSGNPTAVRFEPHHWHRKYADFGLSEEDRDKMTFTRNPNNEPVFSKVASETGRAAFNRAFAINKSLAIACTSFGSYQVMGTNFPDYKTDPDAVMARFGSDPEAFSFDALKIWFDKRPNAIQAAKDKDFMKLASIYNGTTNTAEYGPRIAREYAAFSGTESTV